MRNEAKIIVLWWRCEVHFFLVELPTFGAIYHYNHHSKQSVDTLDVPAQVGMTENHQHIGFLNVYSFIDLILRGYVILGDQPDLSGPQLPLLQVEANPRAHCGWRGR